MNKQKSILITGGTRGIGKAISLLFLQKGYIVYTTYKTDETSAKELQKLGVHTFQVDVSNEQQVVELFQKIGAIDVLVNNAGISLVKQIQDVSYSEFQQVISTNLGGAFLCSREAAKQMISSQSGVIVNISSVWGEVGASCESVYAASKAGVIGFTKSLAKELGWSGIRVNCVSPGVIDTQMNARFTKEEMADLINEIPVGRLGLGEDVAKAVLYLVENDYVTGENLSVNGGFSIV